MTMEEQHFAQVARSRDDHDNDDDANDDDIDDYANDDNDEMIEWIWDQKINDNGGATFCPGW